MLQPERFGLTPNGVDPFFYTGYGINFDDLIREVGDDHYFVSRWTAYLPNTLASSVFGLYWGRLAVRWFASAAVLLSLFHVGRPWWKPRSELGVGVVALTNPMFVRALMTDYVEWAFVAGGIILYCQCFETKVHWARSVAIGVLTAFIFITNPAAGVIAIAPLGVWATRLLSSRHKRIIVHGLVALIGFGATVWGGHLWFSVLYGIEVYAPTIDFVMNSDGVSADPLKSPTNGWLGSFTWVFVPPILVAGGLIALSRDLPRRPRLVVVALGALTFQFILQVLDQFVRDGNGLEISYYWSLIVPSLTMALAFLLGTIEWTTRLVVFFVAGWLGILIHPVVVDTALPQGWWFAALAVAFLAFLASNPIPRGARVAVLVLFCLVSQVAAPNYVPDADHFFNANPNYDRLFLGTGEGDTLNRSAVWLAKQLDSLESDDSLEFMAASSATQVVAIYAPHITHSFLGVETPGGEYTSDSIFRVRLGQVGNLAIFGPAPFVSRRVAELSSLNSSIETLLDAEDDSGSGYRLVVLEIESSATGGAVLNAVDLNTQTGTEIGLTRRALPAEDAPGFLAYGPYLHLEPGAYIATFRYRSDVSGGADDGYVDVVLGPDVVGTAPTPGTGGAAGQLSIPFEVEESGGLAEFRTWWAGGAAMTIESVSVAREGS